MIKNFNDFLNESFTKEISSIKGFLDKVNINNSEIFLEELYNFCNNYDIPLSKVKGYYFNYKKTFEYIKNNSDNQISVFFFDLKKYLGQQNFIKRTEEFIEYSLNPGYFFLVIDLEKQEKGLRDLRRKRADITHEIEKLRDNEYWINKNMSKYRKILIEKRRPEIVDNLFKIILKNTELYKSVFDILYSIKNSIDKETFDKLVDKFFDYKLISQEQLYKLSRNIYW